MATTLSEAADAANESTTVTISVTGADATFDVEIVGQPKDDD